MVYNKLLSFLTIDYYMIHFIVSVSFYYADT